MKYPDLQNLTDYSPPYSPCDAHSRVPHAVGVLYLLAPEYERHLARMAPCGGFLLFGSPTLMETGETRLRLRQAPLCRVRRCPVCPWRRSPMRQPRLYQSLLRLVPNNAVPL